MLEVRTRRRPFSLQAAGEEVAEVALDETMIVVGPDDQPVRLRRVEIEVVPAWVDRLEPLVHEVRAACGLQPATLSKFEAGLMALGVDVPGPVDLGSTQASPDSTTGELAFAVLRRHLGVLLEREPGTRLGEDPEELHDMRVATRRLRAALDLFAPVLPARADVLRSELGWLAGVLGTVRDLDVQLGRMDEMDVWVADGDQRDGPSPLDELRQVLLEEWSTQRTDMLAALESPRWERLAAGLVSMARQGPSRRQPSARQPAALAVPELVAARHLAVTKAARRAKRTGIPADFHRLRIRGKRLRYSLEFTSAVYGARTDRFVKRLAVLQDMLGSMQDAEVATTRLRDLAIGGGHSLAPATVFAMGEVAERYHAEAAALLGPAAQAPQAGQRARVAGSVRPDGAAPGRGGRAAQQPGHRGGRRRPGPGDPRGGASQRARGAAGRGGNGDRHRRRHPHLPGGAGRLAGPEPPGPHHGQRLTDH